jgi:hypothetical protein
MAVVEMDDRGLGIAGTIGLTGLIGYIYFPAFLIMGATGATVGPVEEVIIKIMSLGTGAIDVYADSFRAMAVGFTIISFLMMVFGAIFATRHPMSLLSANIMGILGRLALPVIVVLSLVVTRDLYEFRSTGYQPMLPIGMLIYLASFALLSRLFRTA